MVANDEVFFSMWSFQYIRSSPATIKHISKYINRIILVDSVISVGNQCFLHFLYCGKWTIVETDDILMTKVCVCCEKDHSDHLPYYDNSSLY